MFLVNSRLDLFTAPWSPRVPFSRSYGVILPSSLTTFLSLILGFSPHLPVSVCGTGRYSLDRSFSCQCEISCFGTSISLLITDQSYTVDLPAVQPLALDPVQPSAGSAYPPASLLLSNDLPGTGISTSCPSTTPFGLALGPDLPRADEPSPGTLRFSMDRILTCLSLLMPTFSLV